MLMHRLFHAAALTRTTRRVLPTSARSLRDYHRRTFMAMPPSSDRSSPPKKPRVDDGGSGGHAASRSQSTAAPSAASPSLASSLSVAVPTLSLVSPGKCQFTPEFAPAPLLERHAISSTSSLLRFGLPDSSRPLNLSTCACILAKADLPTVDDGGEGEEKKKTTTEEVVRPYTPISTNAQVGSFDLLVKHYENGRMSKHLRTLPIGATLDFKHIDFNVKLQAPFPQKRIGMLAGGTGVTPMIQALHAILGDEGGGGTKVSMLYGSRSSDDILGRELLDRWSERCGDRFDVTHVLSDEPADSDWTGERGFVSRELVEKHLPGPDLGNGALLFVCGPPPMYDALCGSRNDKGLTGLLAEMGYKTEQVYKF